MVLKFNIWKSEDELLITNIIEVNETVGNYILFGQSEIQGVEMKIYKDYIEVNVNDWALNVAENAVNIK